MDQFEQLLCFYVVYVFASDTRFMDRFKQLSGVLFHTVFVFASDMYE